jgi:glycosyltransferase involved in cell wall biosynthesis
MEIRQKTALIPAYMPDEALIDIVKDLYDRDFYIVVVDDGSKSDYDDIFGAVGKYAKVIRYGINKGKGYALKKGLKYIKSTGNSPYTVVTLDADGQHRISDVINVYNYAAKYPGDVVIGCRKLEKTDPVKSRIGNNITNFLYKATTGSKLSDTQTGLRAFSDGMIDTALKAKGYRYEYEINALLDFSKITKIREIPIETVYIDNNRSTHFRPFKDSAVIYSQFFTNKFRK